MKDVIIVVEGILVLIWCFYDFLVCNKKVIGYCVVYKVFCFVMEKVFDELEKYIFDKFVLMDGN